jgi:type IV secretory pathway TraG/TraD family ATPase VirD4
MLGDTTVVAERVSYNDGGGTLNVMLGKGTPSHTYSQSEHKRPLMTPDEVMRLADNEAIVRTGNRYPMKLWKIYYDAPEFSTRPRLLGAAKALELAVEGFNNNSSQRVESVANKEKVFVVKKKLVEPPDMPDLDLD